MILRLIIIFFLILSFRQGYCGNQKDKTFELELKIYGLGRDYVGCGFENYTICINGIVKSNYQKILLGEEVLLYINCPEVINYLPVGFNYKVKVEFYNEKENEKIDLCPILDTVPPLTKLRVLDIRIVN